MDEVGEAQEVEVWRIIRDPDLQVRKRLVPSRLARLRQIKQSGGAGWDPVTLAKIGDRLILVDGWHRLAVFEALAAEKGEKPRKIVARIIETNRREAAWMAADANLRHGQSYTKGEIRKVLAAFIRARKHRVKDQYGETGLMSYREIAEAVTASVGSGPSVDKRGSSQAGERNGWRKERERRRR